MLVITNISTLATIMRGLLSAVKQRHTKMLDFSTNQIRTLFLLFPDWLKLFMAQSTALHPTMIVYYLESQDCV